MIKYATDKHKSINQEQNNIILNNQNKEKQKNYQQNIIKSNMLTNSSSSHLNIQNPTLLSNNNDKANFFINNSLNNDLNKQNKGLLI